MTIPFSDEAIEETKKLLRLRVMYGDARAKNPDKHDPVSMVALDIIEYLQERAKYKNQPAIMERGSSNPFVLISNEQVLEFIRKVVDATRYADREISMVQLRTQNPMEGGKTYHWETPSLEVMVSNIVNSAKRN